MTMTAFCKCARCGATWDDAKGQHFCSPIVGHVVHYNDGDEVRAAIVTKIEDGDVYLNILYPDNMNMMPAGKVPFSEKGAPGCWSRLPR